MIDETTGLRLPGCRFYVFVKGTENSVRDARGEYDPEPCESYRAAQDLAIERNTQPL